MKRQLTALALMGAYFSAGSAVEITNPYRDLSDFNFRPEVGPRRSSGKGKGKPARRAEKVGRKGSGRSYPFSSIRQDAQAAHTQRMVVVNGFELMQTIPARERKGFEFAARAA